MLSKEIDVRKEKSEQNIIIRYLKSYPAIVQVSKNINS